MLINDRDNVEVNLQTGHKQAIRAIQKGEPVIKYGQPIGIALADIAKGERVHTHNLSTGLGETLSYRYQPKSYPLPPKGRPLSFWGYRRENGTVGIRNDIWIVVTVGCVNKIGEQLAAKTGAFCFSHPFGCSQLGDDFDNTRLILKGLVNHPNAGGVLVLGLGCENNNIESFRQILGEQNPKRVKYLNCQDCEDELARGVELIEELKAYAAGFQKEEIDISKLVIGLKCGGSDGLSGITANPLVGSLCDTLTAYGSSFLMTEVPEMFGAEHLLMERCRDKSVFDKTVRMINSFKDYYRSHNQVIYENPSPGNKAGGITTLEEKSLGCIQKGGLGPVEDVLFTGETVKKSGLSLLNGPGNDMVAVTNLTAAGAQLILFTTGRGTPLGAPVPTLKIATNRTLAKKKSGWIDFNADPETEKTREELTGDLLDCVIRTASGEQTRNEQNGYREISIFKDGVML